MPRFQLLVREPGKEPRTVPLNDPIIVGRSRSVDLPIDDEEVGRKQFRIGVNQGFVVLDSLGTTNPTRIDSRVIKAGESTTLDVGQTITIGKSKFTLETTGTDGERTPTSPDTMGATMVAAGPGPGAPAAAPDPATGDSSTPLNTMEFRPPGTGGDAPAMGLPPIGGETSAKGPQEPPMPGAADPPGDAPKSNGPATDGFKLSDLGQTMAKGFRPGAFPPAASPPTPSPAANPTPPAPKPPPPAPKATPAPPAAAPSPAAPPPAAPPPAAPPPAAPSPPVAPPAPAATRSNDGKSKPKTVAVKLEAMIPAPGAVATGTDLESLLHRSTPRLFVKGEGLKRPVRLMKASNQVGRAESADVLLPHESVSEIHAEICFDGKRWTLVDKGSTNGTIVDGAHLRGGTQEIRRNSLIGMGTLQLIFLCTDEETLAGDRRDEDRALRLLGKGGRLDKGTINEIRQMVRPEPGQSIAEVVLRDTQLSPTEWATAISTVRSRVSLLDRILQLLRIRKK